MNKESFTVQILKQWAWPVTGRRVGLPGSVLWSALLLGTLLLAAPVQAAKRFPQPAYVTNAYFSDKLIKVSGFIQPNAVINLLRANHAGVAGFFVLDLVLEKGEHHFVIDFIDQDGQKIGDMAFDPVAANEDDYVYTAVGAVTNVLPPGWLFFKVYDQIGAGDRQIIGTFRVMSRVIQLNAETEPTLLEQSPFGTPAASESSGELAVSAAGGRASVQAPAPSQAQGVSPPPQATPQPPVAAKSQPVVGTALPVVPAAQPAAPQDKRPKQGQESMAITDREEPPPPLLLGREPPPNPKAEKAAETQAQEAEAKKRNEQAKAPEEPRYYFPSAGQSAVTRGYVVQLGVYTMPEYVEEMKEKVANFGMPVGEKELSSGGKTVTRVFLGPFATRGEAESAANTARARAKLKDAAIVIPYP